MVLVIPIEHRLQELQETVHATHILRWAAPGMNEKRDGKPHVYEFGRAFTEPPA